MARGKGRGGNREAYPAKIGANAAAGSRPTPVMEFTGQQWGEQTEQISRQRDTRAAAGAIQQRQPRPTVDLDAPSERDYEPVTAGLPIGPGPGPEALGLGYEPERDRLRDYLPTLELLASQPGSSSALRHLVRQIRGAG